MLYRGLKKITYMILAFSSASAHAGTEGQAARYRDAYKRPASIPSPQDNAFNEHRYELGRRLFFDPRLSRSNWISCASCHNPGFSWGDGLPTAIGDGMSILQRKTPTILNLAYAEIFMWDGRFGSLEEQAMGPIMSAAEMGLSPDQLEPKIRAIEGYKALFERAYPGEGITGGTIGKAIATFERRIVSAESPFDRWVNGKDSAISDSAKRGFVLFNEKAACAKCHSSWRFTDESFHDIGVADEDKGRGKILPMIPVLQNAFKTPGLRNIDQRAPYLHNGSEKTLADVIAFYNEGGKAKRATQAEDVKPLGLSAAEQQDLLEFLKTLTSQDAAIAIPALPQ